MLAKKYPTSNFNEIQIETNIDYTIIEKMLLVSKEKPLSFFKDVILNVGYVSPILVIDNGKYRENDLNNDMEVLNIIFNSENLSLPFVIGTFSNIDEKLFLSLMKESNFYKALVKNICSDIRYNHNSNKGKTFEYISQMVFAYFKKNYGHNININNYSNDYLINKISNNFNDIFDLKDFKF